ncbi:hypothetical protein BKA70DRAFT_1339644 [Coprinopsis sp. MPI-PUGE-AT-0042]|nr:hypothetical protein BKA70DRAFT_1339644 [Coprinopsis sp. MPI-PUGE-AT-0042]
MDVPTDALRVRPAAPAHEHSIGRAYLAKIFKFLLIVTPITAVSALLCFLTGLLNFVYPPNHLCQVTDYCEEILSLPGYLSFFCALGFLPALMSLDHLLALSPVFGNMVATDKPGTVHGDTQAESTGNADDESRSPSTLGRSSYTRAAAILWVVAGAAAITNAALTIKYNAPFDKDTNPNYRLRVIVGLLEATVDLILVALVTWLGLLCSRARRSILAATTPLDASGTDTSLSNTSTTTTFRVLLNTSPLDVWHGFRGLWDRRTSLDRPVLSLIVSLGWTMFCIMFYISFSPPEWAYFSDAYFFLTVVLTYPFLFKFNAARAAGVIPGPVSRGCAVFIHSLLSLFWIFISASFTTVAIYGLFCDRSSRRRGPYILPCPGRGQLESFGMAILGFLLAIAFGHSAYITWKSKAGIQLAGDAGENSEGGNDMQQGA